MKKGFQLLLKALGGDPDGIRTHDPYIKSVLLYQLSYGIEPALFFKADANIYSLVKTA